MKTTLSTVFSRNNIMNVLLALCTAIEFVYDCGESFGRWYRNGGSTKIKEAVVRIVAALVWTYETVKLGYGVARENAPAALAKANHYRNQLGRAFSYEYSAG